MNKENLKKWGKFALGVVGTLIVLGLVKKYVLPRLPATVANTLASVLP